MAPRTSIGSAHGADAEQLASLTAGMIYAMVQSWVDEGIKPATALRLAPFALIEDQLGVEAIHALGIPERTLRRWRSDVRAQRDSAAHLEA